MLYDKLFSIYNDKLSLREKYEFEYYYRIFSQYVSEEVNQKHEYLSPYRFSKMFDISLEDAIQFFLAISSPDEKGLLRVIYKYRCENCDSLNFYSTNSILNDELSCESCSDEIYAEEKDMDIFVLVFEISRQLIEEFKSLKARPLSKVDADIGRGISVHDASRILSSDPSINPGLKEDIDDYWGIVHE